MTNLENSNYNKKIYYKKNNIVKYVKRLIVENMLIIILKMKRKIILQKT